MTGGISGRYPATRRGIVNEYRITTAPPAMRLQGAHSGGATTRSVTVVEFGEGFSVARSVARPSTPRRVTDTPRAKNNERNIGGAAPGGVAVEGVGGLW